MSFLARAALAAGCLLIVNATMNAADAPKIREAVFVYGSYPQAYFRVQFEKPEKIILPQWGSVQPQALARLPRLISDIPGSSGLSLLPVTHVAFTPQPLEFVGRWPADKKEATFRLVYAVPGKNSKESDPFEGCEWAEVPVTLKFEDLRNVYGQGNDRKNPLRANDIEGLWAAALQAEFARLSKQAPDFTYLQFGQIALSRRFQLPVPEALAREAERQPGYRDVFELFTGGTSMTESLQTKRMLKGRGERQQQTVLVQQLRGIDLAEHPWQKMMEGKKPAPEPLAEMVPSDNYYLRFRSLNAALAVGDWIDLWGGNVLSAFEYRTRHQHLRERYERQLCLPVERFAKALPADLLTELAVTGSDPYVRDGSDITIIFRATDTKKLQEILDSYVAESRAANQGSWKAVREDHGKIVIDSFTTPLREVSLHRVVLDDVVIISNSPVGMRRVLDAKFRKTVPLANSLDFQYMRTCFRADDKVEGTFGFLPDAFIRRMMGPADRIKQLRRAEAQAALRTMTDAAMFSRLVGEIEPENEFAIRRADFLREQDIEGPDGKPVTWDKERKIASSDVYGTIHFATPLIELPIDKATKYEAAEYELFRSQYMRLWTRFSDPIGLRFQQDGTRARFEAYILPLINSSDYASLRGFSGNGTVSLDPSRLAPDTVLMFLSHVSLGGFFGGQQHEGAVFIRLDDSPLLKDLAQQLIRHEREGRETDWFSEPNVHRTVLQLPLVLGVEGKLAELVKSFLPLLAAQIQFDEINEEYRGHKLLGRRVKDSNWLFQQLNPPDAKDPFRPTYFYVELNGNLYFSFKQEPIKRIIDRYLDKKEAKAHDVQEAVNAAVMAVPHAAPDAREAINSYLEWQSHRRALPGNAVWLALHRSRVIPRGANEAEEAKAALHWLGYVPVSPDGSPYQYDRRRDDVINQRHGSARDPQLRPTLSVNSPLRILLEEFKTVRIDLRFREDGIHTTLTWERK